MGWAWIMTGLAGFLATLAAGMWTGWAMRGEHEDSRAGSHARERGGRDIPSDTAPRPPLPFPGQFLLEIEDPDIPGGGDHWYADLVVGADEVAARLEEHLDRSLRLIRGEVPGE